MTDKLEQQRLHFNSISQRYKSARSNESHQELKNLIWADALQDLKLDAHGDTVVLEPMCGFAEGRKILSQALGADFQYHGFDYSDSVVEDLQRSDPSINVEQADVTSFDTDQRFDIIILIGGLHHVPDNAAEVVRNMARLLKPGGIFINLEPTHGNPITRWVRDAIYQRNSLFDQETERAFAVEELQSMFEAAGLSHKLMTFPGLLTYILYYNPDAFPALNKGGVAWVQRLYALERPLYQTRIARWLSFATLSIWQK